LDEAGDWGSVANALPSENPDYSTQNQKLTMKSLDSMQFQKYLNKPDRNDQIRTSANAFAATKLGQGFFSGAA